MKYIERRTLDASELRNLCIRKNWYTNGTTEEYCNLFDMLTHNFFYAEMTTEKLAELATDIYNHSDADDCTDGYLEITDIMFDLAKACHTVFIEQ
jgi:hypothetical protein